MTLDQYLKALEDEPAPNAAPVVASQSVSQGMGHQTLYSDSVARAQPQIAAPYHLMTAECGE